MVGGAEINGKDGIGNVIKKKGSDERLVPGMISGIDKLANLSRDMYISRAKNTVNTSTRVGNPRVGPDVNGSPISNIPNCMFHNSLDALKTAGPKPGLWLAVFG